MFTIFTLHVHVLLFRYGCFKTTWNNIEKNEQGGLDHFTRAYEYMGVFPTPDGGVMCRQWAPGAKAMYIRGDFSKSVSGLL